jgi:hypothetical protein
MGKEGDDYGRGCEAKRVELCFFLSPARDRLVPRLMLLILYHRLLLCLLSSFWIFRASVYKMSHAINIIQRWRVDWSCLCSFKLVEVECMVEVHPKVFPGTCVTLMYVIATSN